MTMNRKARELPANADGATAVEFSLIASGFLTLLLGIAYVAIMLFNNVSLDWAVKQGVRLAEINTAATQDQIAASVNNYLTSEGLGPATVTYSVATNNGQTTASIAANYSQDYTIPFIPAFHITYSSAAQVPQPTPQ